VRISLFNTPSSSHILDLQPASTVGPHARNGHQSASLFSSVFSVLEYIEDLAFTSGKQAFAWHTHILILS
jgi:hypothetical protein